jgi:hypothetical protein
MVSYLAARQPAGGVRPDLDLHAVALLLTGAAHERAVLRRFGAPARLASLTSVVDALLPALTP